MTDVENDSVPGYTDVTFRWRSETPAVVSLHLTGYPGTTVHGGIELTLTETGLYTTTVRLPDETCASYGFLVFESVDAQKDMSIYQVLDNLVEDPHNPDVIHRAFGMRGSTSVLELPDALRHPAWPEAHGNNKRSDVSAYAIQASGRTLTIVPGDEGGPLVVMFDGDLWADSRFGFHDAMVARNNNSVGPSPTAVLVSTPDRAILDKRTLMTQLLTAQILPALDRAGIRWNEVIVAGQSYGGLAAAGLLVDLPDLVDAAIVQSGSFWFDENRGQRDYENPGTITRTLAGLDGPRTNRVVVQVGDKENAMVDQSRWFADAARQAGHDVHFDVYSGGHDYAWYRHGLLYAIDHLCP